MLCKWVLCFVKHTLGLVIGYILNAQIFEDGKECLAAMRKGYCSVVGEPLFYQNMSVEPSHFRNGKDPDTAKDFVGTGRSPWAMYAWRLVSAALCSLKT